MTNRNETILPAARQIDADASTVAVASRLDRAIGTAVDPARRNWLFAVIAVLRISSTTPRRKPEATLTRPLQPPIRTPSETSSALQSVARGAFRSAG